MIHGLQSKALGVEKNKKYTVEIQGQNGTTLFTFPVFQTLTTDYHSKMTIRTSPGGIIKRYNKFVLKIKKNCLQSFVSLIYRGLSL